MATEKVTNYTAEQTAQLVSGYTEGRTVEDLAVAFGKTVRSVVAKLAKEGVYKAKGKEAGKRIMLKSEMVAELAMLVGESEEVMESLEKATGTALLKVLQALRNAQPVELNSFQAPGNE